MSCKLVELPGDKSVKSRLAKLLVPGSTRGHQTAQEVTRQHDVETLTKQNSSSVDKRGDLNHI